MTDGRVAYRHSREVGQVHREIGEQWFHARAWLIEGDGRALGGARAVFRLYSFAASSIAARSRLAASFEDG
jgi:hypothetical protein